MTTLSSLGEVATFPEPVSQFQQGHSAYECVAFSASLVRWAGPPTGVPSGTPAQVIATAEQWYATEEGSNASSNMNGMSLDAEYAMLRGLAMVYQPLPISPSSLHDSDMANVRTSLQAGMPVLICGAETGFYDMGLGDIVPYGWPPSGNHCIVATGIAPSGNFYVRDMANVGHGLVAGSRREYDNSRMDLISGTAIVVPWLSQPSPPSVLEPTPDDLHVWNLLNADIPFDPTHAIPQSWLVGRWHHSYNFGSALEAEQDMTSVYKTAYTVMEQEFTRGRASWHSDTNHVTWYDARGVVCVL
jgi:hypothetical protein